MKTQLETLSTVNDTELTQEAVDERFEAMFSRMEDLYALDYAPSELQSVSELEREAIRNGILGELLEKNPHESIAEIVHSVSLLYEGRAVETRRDDAVVTSFATRDASNQRLDDHFEVIRYDNGDVEIQASCMPFADMGYSVHTRNEDVCTYTNVGSYKIQANRGEKTSDGSSNTHQRILRDFYLQTLSTAGYVLHRRETDPVAADIADQQARAMLLAEKFAG